MSTGQIVFLVCFAIAGLSGVFGWYLMVEFGKVLKAIDDMDYD